MKPKIGLALGGGGSRGSYQIGILKALKEEKISLDIKHVSGSSIGAINTLMVLGDLSYVEMIDLWLSVKNRDVYGKLTNREIMERHGLFDIGHFCDRLREKIPLDAIKKSAIQGYATVSKIRKDSLINQVMLHRMKKEVILLNAVKDPYKVVLASSSIPFVFGATNIEDEHYIDGGALDNCPIQPLIDQGCDIIISVPLDGWFRDKKYRKQDILLINMETQYLFKRKLHDFLVFKPDSVIEKAEYGYKIGKFLIRKLRELNYLDERNNWVRPKGYHLVSISKEEEKKLREEL